MDLFGKKAQQELEELKEELAETQEALEETEQALERYKSKFQRAETEKQEAHRDRKEMEQRMETLKQSIEDATDTDRDVLSPEDLRHVLDSLQGIEFMTAHAYTAYLPSDDAVFADENDAAEIIFFDPYTTGIVLYPPVPVDEDVMDARTFRTEQLQDLVNGTYLYTHLSEDGSGTALITEREIADHVLFSDTDIETVLDETQALRGSDFDSIIVSGETSTADQFMEQVDGNVVQTTSKMAGVTRKNDLQQAFTSAFTVECRRLTEEDIETVREEVF